MRWLCIQLPLAQISVFRRGCIDKKANKGNHCICAFISCWRCSIYGTVRTKLPLERQAWSFQAWLDVMATHLSLWWPQLILQAGTDPVAVIIEKALVLSNVYLGCIWLHDIWYLFKADETWCLRVPSGIKWHYLLWRCIKWHQVALAKAAAIYLQKEGCWGGYNRIAFRPRGAAWRCSLWMVNLRGFPSVLLLYVALLAGKCRWVLLTSQARCRSIFQFCSHTSTMIYASLHYLHVLWVGKGLESSSYLSSLAFLHCADPSCNTAAICHLYQDWSPDSFDARICTLHHVAFSVTMI